MKAATGPVAAGPDKALSSYWRDHLDKVARRPAQTETEFAIRRGKLIIAISSYLRERSLWGASHVDIRKREHYVSAFKAKWDCDDAWLNEWHTLSEYLPGASNRQALARFLHIS